MAEHPVLQRYERECERIRMWCGRPHDEDIAMNTALASWRNSPEFGMQLATLMDDMALAIRQLQALSHAAGQDGEQCRAASVASGEAEELAQWLDAKFKRHGEIEDKRAAELLRALSRGVPEDTKRMDWLVANVTETLTAKSIQGEFPHPEHKTQYVLPRLIAWADFHGQVGFREAIDYALAAQRKDT